MELNLQLFGGRGGRSGNKSSSPGKMMTALVRTPSGNLSVKRYDDYKDKVEFESDLKGNGYRVLNIWNGDVSDAKVDEWEFLHRKR